MFTDYVTTAQAIVADDSRYSPQCYGRDGQCNGKRETYEPTEEVTLFEATQKASERKYIPT